MSMRCWLTAWLALVAWPALGEVTFENTWIRAPLPGQSVTAGYCEITNNGSRPATIVGFSGTVQVEMHATIDEDGMVRMRPLKSLVIAPKTTVALAPGGKHLMLFGLNPDLKQVTLRAVFTDQSEHTVTFVVRPWRRGTAQQ